MLTLYSEGKATWPLIATWLPLPPKDEMMPGATSIVSKPPFSGICKACEWIHAFSRRSS